MAKQEMREKRREAITTEFETQINRRMQETEMRMQAKRARDDFNARKSELANRAAEFVLKHGKEDYRAQIMLTFLDVTLQMEEAIDMMQEVAVAMDCIGQAISCMDGILSTHDLFVENTMTRKYGRFARWKRKRRLKKAIMNNAGRMKQICDSMVGSQEMAVSIVNSLKKSSVKMQRLMERNTARQRSREQKRQKDKTAPLPATRAEQMVDELVRAQGGSPAPAASAGADGGIDDIA